MSSRSLKRTVGAIAIGVVTAAVATASAAPGDTVLRGTTPDGTKVKLTVAEPGNATVFKIAATEATCDVGQLDIEAATFKKFDVSDPGAFSDKRKSKTKDSGYLLKDTFLITGTVAADGASWTGTYDKRTKVFELKGGERVDTCVLSTTWDAQ